MWCHTSWRFGDYLCLLFLGSTSKRIPAGHDDYEDLPEGLLSCGVPELVLDHVTCVKGCPGDKGKVRIRQVEREKHLSSFNKKSEITDRSVC